MKSRDFMHLMHDMQETGMKEGEQEFVMNLGGY
jgi:hypothetical protein